MDNLNDVTANGNIVAIRGRRGGTIVTVLIVGEDGDLRLNGGIQATLPTTDPLVTGQLWTDPTAWFVVKMSS